MDDLTLSYLFKHLQKNNTIVDLDIGNPKMQNRNKLRSKGSVALRGLLKLNKVIQILNLRNLGINFESFQNVIQGVAESGLVSLNLSQNMINSDCILYLNEKHPSTKDLLQDLTLNETPLILEKSLKREKMHLVTIPPLTHRT